MLSFWGPSTEHFPMVAQIVATTLNQEEVLLSGGCCCPQHSVIKQAQGDSSVVGLSSGIHYLRLATGILSGMGLGSIMLPKVCETLNCNLERQNRSLRISEEVA